MKKVLLVLFASAVVFAVQAQQAPVIEVLHHGGTVYEWNSNPVSNSNSYKRGEKRDFDHYYKRRTGMMVDSVELTINGEEVRFKPTSTNLQLWKEVGNVFPFWGKARVLGCKIAYHKYKQNEGVDNFDLSLYGVLDLASGVPSDIMAARPFTGDEITTGMEEDSFTYIAFDSKDLTSLDVSDPDFPYQGFGITVALQDVTAFSDSADIVEVYSSMNGDGYGEKRAFVRLDAESALWAGSEFVQLDRTIPIKGGSYLEFDFDIMLIPVVDVELGDGFVDLNGFQYKGHYPNPTTGNFMIELDVEDPQDQFNIRVSTITGKTVKTMNVGFLQSGRQRIDVDMSELPSGTYHYTITSGRSTLTSQIVVSR